MQSPTPTSQTQLLLMARDGDLVALDELIAILRPHFVRVTRQLAGPRLVERVEIDDLLQEATIHAFASIQGLRATNLAGFRAWFRSIVRHRILALVDEARPRVRPRMTTPLPGDVLSYHSPEGMREHAATRPMEVHESLGEVEHARDDVHDLVTDHRMSLVLHDFFGTEVSTMAFMLGRLNRTSARATRLRALSKLQRAYEPVVKLT